MMYLRSNVGFPLTISGEKINRFNGIVARELKELLKYDKECANEIIKYKLSGDYNNLIRLLREIIVFKAEQNLEELEETKKLYGEMYCYPTYALGFVKSWRKYFQDRVFLEQLSYHRLAIIEGRKLYLKKY